MTLLKWALALFVISLIAAMLGFTNVAAGAADVARFLFFLFLAGAVILLLLGLFAARASRAKAWGRGGYHAGPAPHDMAAVAGQAINSRTTRPCTSVRRKSRPA